MMSVNTHKKFIFKAKKQEDPPSIKKDRYPFWVLPLVAILILVPFSIGEATDAWYSIIELHDTYPSLNYEDIKIAALFVVIIWGGCAVFQEGFIVWVHFALATKTCNNKWDKCMEKWTKEVPDDHQHCACCSCKNPIEFCLDIAHFIIMPVTAILRGGLSFFGLKLFLEYQNINIDWTSLIGFLSSLPWFFLMFSVGLTRCVSSFFVHGRHLDSTIESLGDSGNQHHHEVNENAKTGDEPSGHDSQHSPISGDIENQATTNGNHKHKHKVKKNAKTKDKTNEHDSQHNLVSDIDKQYKTNGNDESCCNMKRGCYWFTIGVTTLCHAMEFSFAITTIVRGISDSQFHWPESVEYWTIGLGSIIGLIMASLDAIVEARHAEKYEPICNALTALSLCRCVVVVVFVSLGAIAHILPAYTGSVNLCYLCGGNRYICLLLPGLIIIDTIPYCMLQMGYFIPCMQKKTHKEESK
jgi:hypothetical protein